MIGHYTQVVSSLASKVGCGAAKCGSKIYAYCNYATGQMSYTTPFLKGQACKSCPNSCSNGLCTCNKVCQNGGVLGKKAFESIIICFQFKTINIIYQYKFKISTHAHVIVRVILLVQNVRMLLVRKLTRNLVVGHPMRPIANTAIYLQSARICANVARSLNFFRDILAHIE